MSVLDVHRLTHAIGGRTLFRDIAFSLADREHVGLIGPNGSGKSTLLRIIAGEEAPDAGEVMLRRGARIGYLAQEPDLPVGATILEAAAAGRLGRPDPWTVEHEVEAMLTRLSIPDTDRTVDILSGGERKRVALARTLLGGPDLLLLDEPTNHLDTDAIEWLEAWLTEFPGTLLLVTHDRYFLDRVVDRNLELALGAIFSYDGGYADYLEQKQAREQRLAAEDEKRRRLVEKELAWARRAPPARTGKARARLRRIESLEEQGRSLRERRREEAPTIERADAPRLGRTVLELNGIDKAFGSRTLIRDFSAILKGGQRIGIIGPNGAGKTTLLRMIAGEESPDAGALVAAENTVMAYYDQRREQLDDDLSVYDNVARSEWVDVGGRRVHARSYLESFLFPTRTQDQKVSSLSGGERNRLMLARLFLKPSNLLLLDEPTNDLDLVTLQVLEDALLDYPGAILVVTHDRWFLDKVVTGLWVFEGAGIVHEHAGGYDLYARLRAAALARDEAQARRVADSERAQKRREAAERRARSRPPRKLSYREQQELAAMEARILEAEAERDRLARLLADPALYTSGEHDPGEVTARFHGAEEEIERLYERWQELEGRRDG